jgi:beta-glucosidase
MSPLIRTLTRWRRRSRWHVAGAVIATLVMAVACLSAGAFSATASAASCGTANLALHQPTTASSVQGPSWPASNATDGSLTTRWSSAFADPQWLQVDLGTPQPLCQVVIHWETAYAKAFQVQASSDAANWTTVYSTTTGTGGTQTLNITGTGRYVRILCTARATQYGDSIYELQVYAQNAG